MHFQKHITYSANKTPYQYRTNAYYHPNRRIIYQGPKIYKEEILYEYDSDTNNKIPALGVEKEYAIYNEENTPQKLYAIRKEIKTMNKKLPSAQLIKGGSFQNIRLNLNEEREPSPKTINIGDTKETIESNIRTVNTRRSPNIRTRFISRRMNNSYDSNEYEIRNDSFDNARIYNKRISYMERPQTYIRRNQYNIENSPINYYEGSGHRVYEKVSDGFNIGGIPYDETPSPHQNYDELNVSNDYERSSENRKMQNYGENTSLEYRQSRRDNTNQYLNINNSPNELNISNGQRIINVNDINNYTNRSNEYNYPPNQNITTILRNNQINNNMNSSMSFAPQKNNYRYMPNTTSYPRDDIQEKYQNQTYNNMTYKDVKKIVNKFTKVYDPNRNDNGLLIENSQVILPGANDDVFNNRYRVLNKMRRLSNILLAKQRPSGKKVEEDYFYSINNSNINNKTSINLYNEDNDNNSDNEYNIRSISRLDLNKRSKTPIKTMNRKSKNNRFKYVSLAMLASKGINSENRIILRKMRLEKGGVVDLGQIERKKYKYKIRKVSRSPGYRKVFYRKNPKFREKAAKQIQEWWRNMKESINIKILKIIKIQSVYRGRFVRKYLYDLLYLNYLYLSFCQKIERVLKKEIKPYIFSILKNYKKKTVSFEEEEQEQQDIKDFNILKNLVASKAKKWKILTMRKYINKWRKYIRNQDKIVIALYKLLKIKAEKNNKNDILRNALRKWDFITKIEIMKNKYDINDEKTINVVITNQNDKIKGLFKVINGLDKFAKKSAFEQTEPKLKNYLNKNRLKNLLRKFINKKELSNKEKLKDYFYKYIKIILKTLNEAEKDKIEEEKSEKKSEPEEIKITPMNEISKTETINIPRTFRQKKEKTVVPPPQETTVTTEITTTTTVERIEKYEKEMENYKNKLEDEERKRKEEIKKMTGRIFLHLINSVKKKQNKNILRKYFTKYFKKIIRIQREEDRKNFEEKERKERAKREQEKYYYKLRSERKQKIISLIYNKENDNKKILKKYFDLWKAKTFNTKESAMKLFVKILDIIIKNNEKKLLHNKINLWRKNTLPEKEEKIIEPKQEQEPDIFSTLKNLKDIINFNDLLRNVYVNKYGKEFLDKLDRTRNPKLIYKNLKKIIRKKNLIDRSNLRLAFNTWKNNVDIEKALQPLKSKLILTLYDKYKNMNNPNNLQKYFDIWKNITKLDNIINEINILKNSQNLAKNLLLKAILRNKDHNNKNELLKKSLNKWKSVLKSDVPKLNNLFNKITKLNIKKNGPEFIDKLNQEKNNNRRKELLLKYLPNRYRNEKMLLYKYLFRWRNNVKDFDSIKIENIFRRKIINILLNKNDKQNLLKAFHKWRYTKEQKEPKLPVNAYILGIQKLKNAFCKKPFEDLANKNNETLPEAPKKIEEEKPIYKPINNKKLLIWKNKLKILQPKIHAIIKKYYLQKYLDKWKDNIKKQRLKNMQIISKWLKKKYDIEKDKKLKRRNELLKRIVNNLIKTKKYELKIPLRLWKRIASILTDKLNATIIQQFCRAILFKKLLDRKHNQNKLINLILNLYKKNLLKEILEPEPYQQINQLFKTKKENNDKLKKIIDDRDKNNDKLLLRLAFNKWNEGKPLYDKNLQKLQNNIRILLSKKKIKDLKLLGNILKKIILSNDSKTNDILRNKFLQWYIIAKKLNYHDTSKIEEFIRKIAIGRLVKKLRGILDRYSNKYLIYLLKNIAKLNKVKNILKKKPNQIALDEIKDYIRKKNINDALNNIVPNKEKNENILLLKKYFDKWRQIKDDIYTKETQSATLIQTLLRGQKIKKDITRKIKIRKILIQIISRYDDNSKLNLYFMRWNRNTKKISCDENARIIQEFCRNIHSKYLKMKKDKNFEVYKKLANIIMSLGRQPKKDFLDKLYNLYKIKKLEKVLNDINDKRKSILKDVFDKLKNNNKLIALRNVVKNKDNKINHILKKILNKWRNKAFNNKYILIFLQKFIHSKEKNNDNILRSALYTWLYKAMLQKVTQKEKIIAEFMKDILKKKQCIKKWKNLVNKLRNKETKNDINNITNDLKKNKSILMIYKIIKSHANKDLIDELKNNNNMCNFKDIMKNIFISLNDKYNGNDLQKYFDIWKNKSKKLTKRLDKLKELTDTLDKKQARDDANTIYQVMLIKKLFNDLPKLYKLNALRRIKDFADNKSKNEKLADDLLRSKKDIKPKQMSPFIKKLYKVYAYKVLDNLFNALSKGLKRNLEPTKYIVLNKMINDFTDRNKDYTYSNQIEKENKPYTKKILFKTKKHAKPRIIQDKSNIQLALISPLVNLIDKLIKKNKKYAYDKILDNHKGEKFSQLLTKYVNEQEKPNYADFINNLKILKDRYENDGPQKAKLYKLLRKYYIKKTFIYKKEIYIMKRVFYLINLTRFNLEMAKSRWLRQIIRKWRFVAFVRKMARHKMEVMYKNLHVSYLEMVNSMFSDEEILNPSVGKEFERFGNNIGMFVNEDPYSSLDEKLCLGIKKQYLFPNANLGVEKITEIKKKEIEKEMIDTKYVDDLKEVKEGDVIVGEYEYDKKTQKDKEDKDKEIKKDDSNEVDEEGEEEEDDK